MSVLITFFLEKYKYRGKFYMNPVPAVPVLPVDQPVASNPIISAAVAVASGCSRFCGLTDLSQAISLIRQGEYAQASGKALEGALRIGVLVAVACCVKELEYRERELGRMEREVDNLSDRLAQQESIRKAEVLKVQKELNVQKEALKSCKIELTNCKADTESTNGYLSECDQKRANFQGANVKLKKELMDLRVELEKRKADASLCESYRGWNPFVAAPTVVIKNDQANPASIKQVELLKAEIASSKEKIRDLQNSLKESISREASKSEEPKEAVVPPLTPKVLKVLYDKSPSKIMENFDAKNFLCRDIPGVPMDCDSKKEINDAFKFSSRRCHPDKFGEVEDKKMAHHLYRLVSDAKDKLLAQATR